MSDMPKSRRTFIQQCSAGVLAAASGAVYGCKSDETPVPAPPPAEEQPPDILESIRPDPATGLAEAVIVKGRNAPLVFTDQIRPRNPSESVSKQLSDVIHQLGENLAAAKSGWGALVRMHFYVRTDAVADEIRKVLARAFKDVHKPAATFVRGELEFPEVAFVLDVVSLSGEVGHAAAIRRTPRAVVLPPGPLLYISGEAVGGAIEEATGNTLAALEATLKFAGCDWPDVAQLKSFVAPMTAVDTVRSAISRYLAGRPIPMLVFVEWKATSSPIEIELVAAVPKARGDAMTQTVEHLNPPSVTTPSKVFSRAAMVKTDRLIYTSGYYGDGPDTGARIRDIFTKLRALAEQAGGNLEHLVKATYYVNDAESSKLLNDIRPEFYSPQRPPAASKAIVQGVGRDGRNITIDMIAAGK